MAIQRYKIALNNALFPLVSTKAQRAARIIPGVGSIGTSFQPSGTLGAGCAALSCHASHAACTS